MQITVRNLGAISHAEIKVKPLTILIGPNNAGKTWLAYLLAGLFGGPAQQVYVDKYADDGLSEGDAFLDTLVNNIVTDGIATLNMAEFVNKEGEKYLNRISTLVPEWIASYLGTTRAGFDQLEVNVTLTDSKEAIHKRVLTLARQSELGFGQGENSALLTAKKLANKPDLVFYTSREKATNSFPESIAKKFVASKILDNFFSLFTQTYGSFQQKGQLLWAFHSKRVEI